MRAKAAITVGRPREEVESLWRRPELRPSYVEEAGAAVTFADAPGERGTEIHVDLSGAGGKLRTLAAGLTGGQPALAKVKDELRRFKQRVETGEIPRSDGSPEGERAGRKLRQRPAQPLEASELEAAGAR